MQLPSSVKCKITGVTHLIVKLEQNKIEFLKWSKQILESLDKGIDICLALDCEGFSLGVRENSLGFVQVAQCFQPNFLQDFDPKDNKKISINLQPGFILAAPFSPLVVHQLSLVFSHRNAKLIMFDFTSDIVAMEEAGIMFNMSHIIDCQCVKLNPSLITMKFAASLKNSCKDAKNCAKYETVMKELENKEINWAVMGFELRDEKDPFSMMCDEKFVNYSSSDIALTAVGLIGALGKCTLLILLFLWISSESTH